MEKLIKIGAILYISIFLLGLFLMGIAILFMTIGLFLTLEFDKAKRGFNFMQRTVLRRR